MGGPWGGNFILGSIGKVVIIKVALMGKRFVLGIPLPRFESTHMNEFFAALMLVSIFWLHFQSTANINASKNYDYEGSYKKMNAKNIRSSEVVRL